MVLFLSKEIFQEYKDIAAVIVGVRIYYDEACGG